MKDTDDPANPSQTRLQEEDLDSSELAQYELDIRAKNLLLFGLSNEIYNAIDNNQTSHGLWKALERLIQGANVGAKTQQTLTLWNYQSFKAKPDETI